GEMERHAPRRRGPRARHSPRDLFQTIVRHGQDQDRGPGRERLRAQPVLDLAAGPVEERMRRRLLLPPPEGQPPDLAARRERRAEREPHATRPDNDDLVAHAMLVTPTPTRRISRPSAGRGSLATRLMTAPSSFLTRTSPSRYTTASASPSWTGIVRCTSGRCSSSI